MSSYLSRKISIAALGCAGLAAFAFAVSAQNIFDITYPISELGNCESQAACKAYCDDPANHDACAAFAEQHGFKVEERSVSVPESGGPGGCDSQETCKTYCDNESHYEACIAFAKEHNLLPPGQIKALEALSEGGPGGCKGREACEAYCQDESHFEECITFAEKKGFIQPEEAARARKFHIETGPGGCKGKDACEVYCRDQSHQEECLTFAVEHGFIPKEEALRARKFMKVSEEGGPGGCRGQECKEFCEKPENRDGCFKFAKEHDLISREEEEDFERGQKLSEKVKEAGGPGGCRDERACMQYCQDPAHFEECLGFASAHGGMDPAQAEQMLKRFIDAERLPGEFGPPGGFDPASDEHFRRFEEFEKLEREFRGSEQRGITFPPGGVNADGKTGPAGCDSPEACIKYCLEHKEGCGIGGPPDTRFQGNVPAQRPPEGYHPPGGNFQRPPEGDFHPPEGSFPPPESQFRPSENFQPPQNFQDYRQPPDGYRPPEGFENYQQPPEGSYQPPLEPPPPPPSAYRSVITRTIATVLLAPIIIIEALFR